MSSLIKWKILNGVWNQIKWSKIQLHIDNWQAKIYYYSRRNDISKVRSLQRSLFNSRKVKLLVIYKVLKQNRFIPFPGLDILKNITLQQRLELGLRIGKRIFPSFRRCIFSVDSINQRRFVLFISDISDRCQQELFKLILQPEWESRFDFNSFGFRTGRGSYNVLHFVYSRLGDNKNCLFIYDFAKHVLCKEQNILLYKFNLTGMYKFQLINWVNFFFVHSKAEIQSSLYYFQGRSILLLIINIIFCALVPHLHVYFLESVSIVSYSNFWLVSSQSSRIIMLCRARISKFLEQSQFNLLYLKVNFNLIEGNYNRLSNLDLGIDLIGFKIRRFFLLNSFLFNRLNTFKRYQLYIYPSLKSLSKHQKELHDLILVEGKRFSQKDLIDKLNVIIKPWVNYFGNFSSNLTGYIVKQDYLLYLKLYRWIKRQKGSFKKGLSYWQRSGSRRWVFMTKDRNTILNYHLHYV